MTKVEVEIHDDVITTISKIKDINDSGVEIIIPEGSVLFENIINLKLIKQYMEDSGITIHFSTQDEVGNNLIYMMEEEKDSGYTQTEENRVFKPRRKFSLSRLLPILKIPKISLSKAIFGKKFLVFPLLLLMLVGGILFATIVKQRATVKISVKSQPFVRSVTIKIKKDATTSDSQKILRGYVVSATVEEIAESTTTGQKTIGEKAKGTITIFNNTDNEKKFEKGEILKSDDLKYLLDDSVTVPARTELSSDPNDPTIVSYKKGETEADIVAQNIGGSYNMESGKSMNFDKYKSSEFSAKTKTDIDGGKSETIKIVSQEDLTKLSANLITQSTDKASNTLSSKVGKGQRIVPGAQKVEVVSEVFSHKVGDQTEKITLNQTVSAEGLAYSQEEMDKLMDKILETYIPQNRVLSEKERKTEVQVLGNSTNSVLTSTEADVQATIKAYIVVKINEEDLKKSLAGKSVSQAERVIAELGTDQVSTYSIVIKPRIPFFSNMPKNTEKISLEIERE